MNSLKKNDSQVMFRMPKRQKQIWEKRNREQIPSTEKF